MIDMVVVHTFVHSASCGLSLHQFYLQPIFIISHFGDFYKSVLKRITVRKCEWPEIVLHFEHTYIQVIILRNCKYRSVPLYQLIK